MEKNISGPYNYSQLHCHDFTLNLFYDYYNRMDKNNLGGKKKKDVSQNKNIKKQMKGLNKDGTVRKQRGGEYKYTMSEDDLRIESLKFPPKNLMKCWSDWSDDSPDFKINKNNIDE